MRVLKLVLVIVIAVAVTAGYRWYRYIGNDDSPYDEVGITLNSQLPLPVRKWGCDRLHATFGNVLPPYGCQKPDGDGRSWL